MKILLQSAYVVTLSSHTMLTNLLMSDGVEHRRHDRVDAFSEYCCAFSHGLLSPFQVHDHTDTLLFRQQAYLAKSKWTDSQYSVHALVGHLLEHLEPQGCQ